MAEMDEMDEISYRSERRWRFDWLTQVLIRPRKIFAQIVSASVSNWQVPILVILVATLLEVIAAGTVKQTLSTAGQTQFPPGYEYYTPEQQAQFNQAMSATSSPVFIYLLPALAAIGKVFIGWIFIGGVLHLVLTLLGARGEMGAMMNLVAWAALPFAIRSIVRASGIVFSQKLISSPGLSGFVSMQENNTGVFLAALLSSIDIYLIWYIALLTMGIRISTGFSWVKVISVVLATLLLALGGQALLNFAATKLSGLTIIRPFF